MRLGFFIMTYGRTVFARRPGESLGNYIYKGQKRANAIRPYGGVSTAGPFPMFIIGIKEVLRTDESRWLPATFFLSQPVKQRKSMAFLKAGISAGCIFQQAAYTIGEEIAC